MVGLVSSVGVVAVGFMGRSGEHNAVLVMSQPVRRIGAAPRAVVDVSIAGVGNRIVLGAWHAAGNLAVDAAADRRLRVGPMGVGQGTVA